MGIEFGLESKQALADHLGGKLVEYDSAIAVVRGWDSLRIEFLGDQHDAGVLIFSVRCNLDRAPQPPGDTGSRPQVLGLSSILCWKETAKDRKGRRLGLNRRIRTADSDFDKQVFVESNAPNEYLKVVLSEENRRRIATLLEHQIRSVEIHEAGVLVIRLGTHIQTVESASQLAKQLAWLLDEALSLKATLPVFVGESACHGGIHRHNRSRSEWKSEAPLPRTDRALSRRVAQRVRMRTRGRSIKSSIRRRTRAGFRLRRSTRRIEYLRAEGGGWRAATTG